MNTWDANLTFDGESKTKGRFACPRCGAHYDSMTLIRNDHRLLVRCGACNHLGDAYDFDIERNQEEEK